MELTLGTFNLNNLFSRFNYEAEVTDLPSGAVAIESETVFEDVVPGSGRFRTYQGRLVKAKDPEGTAAIASRIKAMDLDVLCVQEVEDIDTLRNFVRDHLDGMYRWVALIEGNDPRLIDLGVLSKLPLGGVTSWQHTAHPEAPGELVFSRDLLQAAVLDAQRSRTLLTVFNNHLKSHFVPFGEDPVAGAQAANERRRLQAEMVAAIVAAETRPDGAYAIVGDMNDAPAAAPLAPLVGSDELRLVDGLADPEETRPAKPDDPPPPGKAWTHRFKAEGPAHYELFDHIWLSSSLGARQTGAFIDRRTKHGGDGSDHDPAWVVVDL